MFELDEYRTGDYYLAIVLTLILAAIIVGALINWIKTETTPRQAIAISLLTLLVGCGAGFWMGMSYQYPHTMRSYDAEEAKIDQVGFDPYLPAGACETLTLEVPTKDLETTYLVFGNVSNPRDTSLSVSNTEDFDEFLAMGEAIRLNPGGEPLEVRTPKDYYSNWE